jgi:hypothetical protein
MIEIYKPTLVWSESFTRLNIKTPTATGWKTSKTGASAVSYGGATAYRLTSFLKEVTW